MFSRVSSVAAKMLGHEASNGPSMALLISTVTGDSGTNDGLWKAQHPGHPLVTEGGKSGYREHLGFFEMSR